MKKISNSSCDTLELFSLEELDIGHDELTKIVGETLKIQRLLAVNPRSINREDAVKLLERMWHGFS